MVYVQGRERVRFIAESTIDGDLATEESHWLPLDIVWLAQTGGTSAGGASSAVDEDP